MFPISIKAREDSLVVVDDAVDEVIARREDAAERRSECSDGISMLVVVIEADE